MNKRLNKCPLCNSGLFINHTEVRDHSISEELFQLCKCRTCDLIFTNPRPSKKSIGKYYDFDDYISHKNKSTNFTNYLYKLVRTITLRSKLNILSKYTKPKTSILDYGCGTGYFLRESQNKGYITRGIEPDKKARETAQSFGLQIDKNIKEIEELCKYETITLFHVMEHIHPLRKTIKKLAYHLKEEGTLIIAVPNIDSWDSIFYKEHWAALDVPRHLYHFNQESIENLAKEMNLKIIQKRGMIFDSFYISILSEKAKFPNQLIIITYIKAFINGLKSNLWAQSNNQNYSSLLYIFKKK